jgi:tetratricopeptide (TPR) repeat protein
MLAYPKAKEAAIRALEIDDGLAEAHCAIGCINAVYDRDWNRAKRSFQLAVDLNPSYATAHQWFAVNCLSPLGRHSEALAHLRQAQEVDPLSITIPASVGLALHLAGRYDDAIQQCRLTLEMDETFWLTHLFLGWACEQTGLVREAIEAFHTSIERSHSDPVTIASLAHLLGRQGQTAEALQLIEKLLAFAKIRYVPAAEIAIAYLGLGQDDQAQQWLHKAQKEHSFRLSYANVDPRLAGISLPA